MSWARRPFAPSALQDQRLGRSLVQLVFAESKQRPQTSTRWVCRQCQSNFGARRSLVTSSATRTVTTEKEPRRSVGVNGARRHVFDEAKAKDGNVEETELPSATERRRSTTTKRFASVMDNLQANIFFAGQRLNDLTGYSGIEKLKQEIQEQERALRAAQEQLTHAKQAFTAAIQQRSDSQREVNELLQRKNNWSPQDLERFTSLYRSDHANEQAETDAQHKLNEAERLSEEAGANLSAKILARYHEEQIWSDKIRRMSTWGTWGLMGVNVLLFLVFQVAVEPWRRRRLVTGFEQKVIEALEAQKEQSNKATGEALAALQASHVAATRDANLPISEAQIQAEVAVDEAVSAEVAAEAGLDADALTESTGPATGFEAWLPGLQQHRTKLQTALGTAFSEAHVTVRQVDLTKRLLEGIFAGVMFTSIFAAIIRGR